MYFTPKYVNRTDTIAVTWISLGTSTPIKMKLTISLDIYIQCRNFAYHCISSFLRDICYLLRLMNVNECFIFFVNKTEYLFSFTRFSPLPFVLSKFVILLQRRTMLETMICNGWHVKSGKKSFTVYRESSYCTLFAKLADRNSF